MRLVLPVTPELVRAYAGQNCWAGYGTDGHCGQRGPSGSICTLRKGHSGAVHIAHNYAITLPEDHDAIYCAWMDLDPDLDVDEGL